MSLEPSLIISSGRGIYLKYLWSNPLSRQATGRFVSVNRRLVERFKEWGADPAAVDGSRVLRVVGTTNSKNGERTAIIHQAERDGQVLTYNFDHFADEILPYTAAEYREIKAARKARAELRILSHEKARRAAHERAEQGRVGNQRGLNREHWHWGILEDLRTLAALRYHDGIVPEGWRATFGHVGACQLAMVVPADQLWHEIRAWSRILLPANYRETPQFRSDCSTLLHNAQRAERGELVEWNGRKVTPIYTYKADTLIQLLQITGDEMRLMTRLIDNDEKKKRHNEVRRAAATGLTRDEWLAENPKSRNKPWEKEGISRCHWYRNQRI